MDRATYRKWWQWHLRVARGESLSRDEQFSYDAGRRELETQERFSEATSAREAREALAALEEDHARLEKRRAQLDAEIVALESRLTGQARQYLGVED